MHDIDTSKLLRNNQKSATNNDFTGLLIAKAAAKPTKSELQSTGKSAAELFESSLTKIKHAAKKQPMLQEEKENNQQHNTDGKDDVTIETQEKPGFASFGRPFQENVCVALLTDQNWATGFAEVFNVDQCLEIRHLKYVSHQWLKYYKVYREWPTHDLLKTIINDDLKHSADVVLKAQAINFIDKHVINATNFGDLPWVKERAMSFCRQQLMKKALSESLDLIQSEKYDLVVKKMKEALSSGMTTTVGHLYNSEPDARYSTTYRNIVTTGIQRLNEVLQGGLGGGEIGIVVAPTSVGKSHFLTHIGASAISVGANVFHYSFELSERYVGVRYDSNLVNIDSNECHEHLDEIKAFVESNKSNLGQLVIKEYPPRMKTVTDIRAHIDKMLMKGVRPNLIIVDYAGLLRSTEKSDLMRHEMQFVIQELRALGKELNVPIWTALQANRGGAKAEFVDMTDLSESYGQAGEADVILGLQRTKEQKNRGTGSLYVAKNRLGTDGHLWLVKLNTARSFIEVMTEDEVEAEKAEEDVAKEKTKIETMNVFKDSMKEVKKRYGLQSASA